MDYFIDSVQESTNMLDRLLPAIRDNGQDIREQRVLQEILHTMKLYYMSAPEQLQMIGEPVMDEQDLLAPYEWWVHSETDGTWLGFTVQCCRYSVHMGSEVGGSKPPLITRQRVLQTLELSRERGTLPIISFF